MIFSDSPCCTHLDSAKVCSCSVPLHMPYTFSSFGDEDEYKSKKKQEVKSHNAYALPCQMKQFFLSASLFSVLLMSLTLIYALFNVSDLLKVGFIFFFKEPLPQ